jgi:SulP family sulfate permease
VELRDWVPAAAWVPRYRRDDLWPDTLAGFSVAAMAVPVSLGYAQVQELPPIYGLYACVVPALVYLLLGSSRVLSVGPLVSISIIAADGVSSIARPGSEEFIRLSATLAVISGALLLLVGLLRLGKLIGLVPEPVLTGLLSGVGVVIIAVQLDYLLGIPHQAGDALDSSVRILESLDLVQGWTVLISALTIGFLAVMHRWTRVPGPLIAVVVGICASGALDLAGHGIATVGSIPSGLAGPKVPLWSSGDAVALLPAAAAVVIVTFVESMALSKTHAESAGYRVAPDTEARALGAANVGAGFFQGFVVSGVASRTSLAEEAGARTQLAGGVAATAIAAVLVLATGAIAYLPLPVLGAVVAVVALKLVKVHEAARLWRSDRADFALFAIAAGITILTGPAIGVVVAVIVSIPIAVIRRRQGPHAER